MYIQVGNSTEGLLTSPLISKCYIDQAIKSSRDRKTNLNGLEYLPYINQYVKVDKYFSEISKLCLLSNFDENFILFVVILSQVYINSAFTNLLILRQFVFNETDTKALDKQIFLLCSFINSLTTIPQNNLTGRNLPVQTDIIGCFMAL